MEVFFDFLTELSEEACLFADVEALTCLLVEVREGTCGLKDADTFLCLWLKHNSNDFFVDSDINLM